MDILITSFDNFVNLTIIKNEANQKILVTLVSFHKNQHKKFTKILSFQNFMEFFQFFSILEYWALSTTLNYKFTKVINLFEGSMKYLNFRDALEYLLGMRVAT